MSQSTVKAGYRGSALNWEGVIKVDDRVVWTCGHSHHNRDQSTHANDRSAVGCASACLRLATNPGLTDELRNYYNRTLPPFPSRESVEHFKWSLTQIPAVRAALSMPPLVEEALTA